MDRLDYLKAKIYALSGQPKFRGAGVNRHYNCFFDYAYIELEHFINEVASIPGRGRAGSGLIVAREFRKFLEDDEARKKCFQVCPLSEKQAYVLAKTALENGIELMSWTDIVTEPDNYEYDDDY